MPTQVFSCEICWIFKSTYFEELLWTTASDDSDTNDVKDRVFNFEKSYIYCPYIVLKVALTELTTLYRINAISNVEGKRSRKIIWKQAPWCTVTKKIVNNIFVEIFQNIQTSYRIDV